MNKLIYLLLSILILSCSTSKKRVIVNYQPYTNEKRKGIELENYKDLKVNQKEESISYDEFELEIDKELEDELILEYRNENEKSFYDDLGTKIKIDYVFSYPLKKFKITSHYGKRNHPINKKVHFHRGVDLKSSNKKIYAIKEGKVIISKYSKTYGNIVAIRHANGLTSLYAHNKVNYVKKGTFVKRNQVIGIMGNTGYVTGEHLHFELRKYNKNINPLNFFRKKIIN